MIQSKIKSSAASDMLVFHKRALKEPVVIAPGDHQGNVYRAAMLASVELKAGGDFLVTDANCNPLRTFTVAYSGPK